ncbi:capsular polysaccharide synthesis protein [Roseobacter sp. HKCCD5988]|uniref:capsular polysaccharide synthesis protein n=1 Tax=Roseobacter sp. HKCCD5988 TaxID=3120338 RepID=UPI0030ED7CE5
MISSDLPILEKMQRFGSRHWYARMQALSCVRECIDQVDTKSHCLPSSEVPKIIWFYWSDGYDNAPKIVQYCFDTLKSNNKNFVINFVDDKNINRFVKFPPKIFNVKNDHIAHFSDILRVELLRLYGGYWVDATVLATSPIDTLAPNSKENFFVFSRSDNHIVSSWFIKSPVGSYEAEMLSKVLSFWWQNNSELPSYYWFHHIYEALVIVDPKFKDLYRNMPKLSALPCLQAARYLSYNYRSTAQTLFISCFPLHKLTHKSDLSTSYIFKRKFQLHPVLFKMYCFFSYKIRRLLRYLKYNINFSSVIFVFHGGLGNQLFQYNFLRSYLKTDEGLPAINLSFYKEDFSSHRSFLIDKIISKFELFNGMSFNKIRFFRILSRLSRCLGFNSIVIGDSELVMINKSHAGYVLPRIYFGYWHELNISDETLTDITNFLAGYSLNGTLEEIFFDVRRGGVAFLHIRRGDYLQSEGFHTVLGVDYYRKSMELLLRYIKNVRKVLIFTDDVEWSEKHVSPLISVECINVSALNSCNDVLAELKLMSACVGGIIANSTFSWWGAAIGRFNHDNHVVIAPANYIMPSDFDIERDKLWLSPTLE